MRYQGGRRKSSFKKVKRNFQTSSIVQAKREPLYATTSRGGKRL